MQVGTRLLSYVHAQVVPDFVNTQVKILGKELSTFLSSIYRGPVPYRYQGEEGDDLRSRWIFTSDNPWELGRQILLYGVLASVGYLLASVFSPWLATGTVIAGGFFILSTIDNYRQGNHLKKALELIIDSNPEPQADGGPIVPPSPLDKLPAMKWNFTDPLTLLDNYDKKEEWMFKKVMNAKEDTIGVVFRSCEDSIRVYYFGSKNFSRMKTVTSTGIKFIWQKSIEGKEIKALMEAKKAK